MTKDFSRYTFVKWGRKLHLLDKGGNLCCGRSPQKQVELSPPPKDEKEICIVCWWNREWFDD